MKHLLFLFLLSFSISLQAQISIIGTATPNANWTNDYNMIQTGTSSEWTVSTYLYEGEFKFRANNSWAVNWGGDTYPMGTAIPEGNNIVVPIGGFYLISFDTTSLIYNVSSGSVGINDNHPQATLDISGNIRIKPYYLNPINDVFAIPANVGFVVLQNVPSFNYFNVLYPITNTYEGLRLTIDNTTGLIGVLSGGADVPPGLHEFIFSDGEWKKINVNNGSVGWSLNGNSNTNAETNFIGTTDDQPLVFRTNNIENMRLTTIPNLTELKIKSGIEDTTRIVFNKSIMSDYIDLKMEGKATINGGFGINFSSSSNSPVFQQSNLLHLDAFTGNAGFGIDAPQAKVDVNGDIRVSGQLLPNGNYGTADQVLTANGNGTMSWMGKKEIGEVFEVDQYTDTTGYGNKGYKFLGSKDNSNTISLASFGKQKSLTSHDQVSNNSNLFYYSAGEKIFVVSGDSIYSISTNENTYGQTTSYVTPSFNLDRTIPLYTNNKILIYPYLIFDCGTGTSTVFPANTCTNITPTKSQIWSGSKLILYGPTGGFTFDPITNVYTCIEIPGGNMYHKGCSATWIGNQAVFYGGYVIVNGDTLSRDIGITYNPTSNLWDNNFGTPNGSLIHNHKALWTGTELVLWGGRSCDLNSCRNFYGVKFFNPSTELWTSVSSNDILSNAILVGNKLFFQGNRDDRYLNITTKSWVIAEYKIHKDYIDLCTAVKINNDIFLFPYPENGNELKWIILQASLPTPITYPGFNCNIVSGGLDKNLNLASNNSFVFSFSNHEGGLIYNTNKKLWKRTNTTNQPIDRSNHLVLLINNNKFLVWGGKNGSTFLNDGAIYDAITDTWTIVNATGAPSPREDLSGAFNVNNNKVLIWGGKSGGDFLNTGAIFNTLSNTWSAIPLTNSPSANVQQGVFTRNSDFIVLQGDYFRFTVSANSWTKLTEFTNPLANILQSGASNKYHLNYCGNINDGKVFDFSLNEIVPFDNSLVGFVASKIVAISTDEFLINSDVGAEAPPQSGLYFNALTKEFRICPIVFKNFYFQKTKFIHKTNELNEYVLIGAQNFAELDPGGKPVIGLNISLLDTSIASGPPITTTRIFKTLLFKKV